MISNGIGITFSLMDGCHFLNGFLGGQLFLSLYVGLESCLECLFAFFALDRSEPVLSWVDGCHCLTESSFS